MSAEANILSYLLGGLVVALVIFNAWLLNRQSGSRASAASSEAVLRERLQSREEEITTLRQSLETSRRQCEREQADAQGLREQLARAEALRQEATRQHEEKLQLLLQARQELTLQFQQLAGDILEEKGKRFEASSHEKLQALLKPLGDRLQGFEKRVEETYDKETQQRSALDKHLTILFELNTRMSVEANNLTRALRGENKTQGIWGEMILERVLEKSGLEKGREYEIQVSLADGDGGKGQPDVVVHLPEGKDVVVDSKVSLVAYQAYFAAEDEETRAGHLRQHLASIRAHVRALSEKNYQHLSGINTLDYVLMFLPVEAAFTLAVQQDEQLFTDAFARNIILVGPSTLLATLRTIQSIWRYEYQNRNAQEIAEQAGRLYDKFADFVKDIEEVGQRLEQTQKAWEQSRNKLVSGRGNLLGRTEKLRKLGARTRKALPSHLLGNDDAGDEDPLAESDDE